MSTMTALILIGVAAMVAAGAGFAFVQSRRFTDRDADGEPDAIAEEIAETLEHDAWQDQDALLDADPEDDLRGDDR